VKRINPIKTAQSGFTLIEVIVTMAVFIIILIIAGEAFKRLVTQASKLSNMEESNIEGVIGLEIMRHDLEQMGFGLPWGWAKPDPAASGSTVPTALLYDDTITISYNEAVDTTGLKLNDATGKIPRAVALSDSSGNGVFGAFTSAYIAIKATTLGSTKASQRWTNIPYHNYSGSPRESRPVIGTGSPAVGDKVTVMAVNFNDANLDHRLIVDPANNAIFYQNFSLSSMSDNYLPFSELFTYMVYGVDSDTNPRMPFNRADFFIKIPSGTATTDGSLPSFCAPRTGVLYKATVNHADGAYRYMPLLDCVADMQVVLGWDSSEDGGAGVVDVYSKPPKADGSIVTSVTALNDTIKKFLYDSANPTKSPENIRKHLKMIKVYILVQEGKLDNSYTAPVSNIEVGDSLTDGLYPKRIYSLSTAQQKYRWKLYRIVARPKNLSSNQH
jgi:prepilin-type N-terminal cleavage/methylation domain-containing protein